MRKVGWRKDELEISYLASGELLKAAARWNEEMQRGLPTGRESSIPRGVRHFKTLAEANVFEENCLIDGMVRIATGLSKLDEDC